MRAKLALLALLAVAVAGGPALAAKKTPLRKFSYTGAGTNSVNVQTGELRETWKGKSKQLGKITAHVAGWIQRPNPQSLVVHTSMVIVDKTGDVLIGACSGSGTVPNPKGSEDWTCDATGGTGKFKHSRGKWKLHIEISRVSIKNGVQKNRFTESGSGRISWSG